MCWSVHNTHNLKILQYIPVFFCLSFLVSLYKLLRLASILYFSIYRKIKCARCIPKRCIAQQTSIHAERTYECAYENIFKYFIFSSVEHILSIRLKFNESHTVYILYHWIVYHWIVLHIESDVVYMLNTASEHQLSECLVCRQVDI